MARFLLVHGSCHGAWCWRDVLPHLHAAGHDARAIDLPAHGADRTPVADVTLDGYVEAILAALDGPAVLVGHSAAGFPISAVAERAPGRIRRLVYLCAYAPVSGRSLVEMRKAGPRQPLLDAIALAPDGRSFTIDPAKARDRFYHDCPDEAVAYALARLCPEPTLPQRTPVALGARYAGVDKHYILCEHDRTIPPEYQATMTETWPEGRVTRLPASHSPFFSMPDRLARRLMEIAA